MDEINNCIDSTLEISSKSLKKLVVKNVNELSNKGFGLYATNEINELGQCNVYIVTVPTPIDDNKRPVLEHLINASRDIGTIINKGDIVIYESTVYPGLTEDVCIPEIEKISNYSVNDGFYVGYSPERINPGDKSKKISEIVKVTSGSNEYSANIIDKLYKSIITAGTFKAKSIKVAEAAKVIENAQRDINIAFVNELSKIFGLMNINTSEVLEAASTKWNFLNFKPGLVGGHCIGVDPYYLAQKAQEVGYHPEIILAGRRINDSMGSYVGNRMLKLMVNKELKIKGSNILILGITFKENCPDVRNSKVFDLINHLKDFGCNIDVFDPWANKKQVFKESKIKIFSKLPKKRYEGIILAVAHNEFLDIDFNSIKKYFGYI